MLYLRLHEKVFIENYLGVFIIAAEGFILGAVVFLNKGKKGFFSFVVARSNSAIGSITSLRLLKSLKSILNIRDSQLKKLALHAFKILGYLIIK